MMPEGMHEPYDVDTHEYTKYLTGGAYHWRITDGTFFRQLCPRTKAIYDSVVDAVRREGGLALQLGLDVGCGDGVLLHRLLRTGNRAIGVDVSLDGLQLAKQEIRRRRPGALELVQASAEHLPFESGRFDYVLATELIEHVLDPQRAVEELSRMLRPDGLLVMTTPHGRAGEPPRSPFHYREFEADALQRLLADRFQAVHLRGLFHERLDRIYLQGTGFVGLDRLIRYGLRLVTLCGANPFAVMSHGTPGPAWTHLLAVGRRR